VGIVRTPGEDRACVRIDWGRWAAVQWSELGAGLSAESPLATLPSAGACHHTCRGRWRLARRARTSAAPALKALLRHPLHSDDESVAITVRLAHRRFATVPCGKDAPMDTRTMTIIALVIAVIVALAVFTTVI
jgi:hypothetical protein